jgi:hypothetical protein
MVMRVSRQYVEALVGITPTDLGVSRQRVEALFVDDTPVGLKVSRQHVDVLFEPPDPELKISRQYVEVLHRVYPELKVSRQRTEVLFVDNTPIELRVSRQQVEALIIDGTPPGLTVSRQLVEVLYPVRVFYGDGASIITLTQDAIWEISHLTYGYYGTIYEAREYFSNRLHGRAWTNSNPLDRKKALWAAALIIDALNYKGDKHSESQFLEFPRDDDTEVPEEIRVASYEIAYSLLDGKNPDDELENLAVIHHGIGSARSSYSRNQVPLKHIINGVPSEQAWRLLQPYLREDGAILLTRIS